MAKKQDSEPIEYVSCNGCIFIQAYEDFKGHGFCAHRSIKMIQVIETPKPCVWKQQNGGQ